MQERRRNAKWTRAIYQYCEFSHTCNHCFFVRYRKDGHCRLRELSAQVAQLRGASAQFRRDAAPLRVLCGCSAGDVVRSARGGPSVRPCGLLVVSQPYFPDVPLRREHQRSNNRGWYQARRSSRYRYPFCPPIDLRDAQD